jgi:hypothetical protein
MDGDDISVQNRFSKLLTVMENTSGVVACSSSIETFSGYQQIWSYPSNSEVLKILSIFKNPIGHASSIFSSEALFKVGGYTERYPYMEDLELYYKLAQIGKLTSTQEVLYRYRVASNRLQESEDKKKTFYRFYTDVFKQREIYFELDQLEVHYHLAFGIPYKDLRLVSNWIKELKKWNKASLYFDQESLASVLDSMQNTLIYKSIDEGLFDVSSQLKNTSHPLKVLRYFISKRMLSI